MSILKRFSGQKKSEAGPGPSVRLDSKPLNRVKWCRFADRHFQYYPAIGQIKYRRWELYRLIEISCESFQKQPTLIDVEPPLTLVGDIHGQVGDLLRILITIGRPPEHRYLFLGDYVDRGPHSLECIALLLCYKVLYPSSVYLIRGNHECARINRAYGFSDELKRRFKDRKLWRAFQKVFDLMPICALIQGKIFCMHGGLSPELQSLDQLRQMKKPLEDPRTGLPNDIMWSDPDLTQKGWGPNPRQTSYVFGEDVLTKMFPILGIDLIARAHQVCEEGYRMFGNKKLVTIFSASHYCNEHNNSAAVMMVDTSLVCTFTKFEHEEPIPIKTIEKKS